VIYYQLLKKHLAILKIMKLLIKLNFSNDYNKMRNAEKLKFVNRNKKK
jgi:hypothetical protein